MKDKLFRDILPRVAKPARYSGGEYNMIKKRLESEPDLHGPGLSRCI